MRETKPLLFWNQTATRRLISLYFIKGETCITQTREQVKVFFKQSFSDDKLPTRYLIKAVYSPVCVFHRRGSELMELPKVWVERLPARSKDRKLTSREEAYFARSWNKLEDGERKKKIKISLREDSPWMRWGALSSSWSDEQRSVACKPSSPPSAAVNHVSLGPGGEGRRL